MAEICPFQAWRYDATRFPLSSVVTQPYDKITPQMQERYYQSSPHNLVRIILGISEADDARNNVYSRAAAYFKEWRTSGVLIQDREASIYVYSQQFEAPSEPGRKLERRGFIALGKLHDYGEQVVFRHEQTLSKPKADRLNLLRATKAHFGQIFMLYDDPSGDVDSFLSTSGPPIAEVRDDYGVLNRLWKIVDPRDISNLQRAFAARKLIIADGHHRYETALNYRNERRAEQAGGVQMPYDYLMMTFVNLHSPGLIILPTHRVVSDLPGFDAERFLSRAAEFFKIENLGSGQSAAALTAHLRSLPPEDNPLLAVTPTNDYALSRLPDKSRGALSSSSERQRKLDVVVLHKLLLERVLGLSEDAIREQKHVSYLRDADEAVGHVRRREANVAFLMNPVKAEQMRDVALAGELMPQKSTDFYPKLLSGLAIYALD